MPFELDITLNPVLAPLAWLVGRWEGAGVLGYPTIESANFGQELEITHDGRPFLEMSSRSWLLDEAGEKVRPLGRELGFWRVLDNGEIELLLTHHRGGRDVCRAQGSGAPCDPARHGRCVALSGGEGVQLRCPDVRLGGLPAHVGHGHGGGGSADDESSLRPAQAGRLKLTRVPKLAS